MPFKQGAKDVFVSGRGDVSKELAKSDAEVMHEESEILMDGEVFPSQSGEKANVSGAKPIYATGEESPFHKGRGLGRGHGPETAKNA